MRYLYLGKPLGDPFTGKANWPNIGPEIPAKSLIVRQIHVRYIYIHDSLKHILSILLIPYRGPLDLDSDNLVKIPNDYISRKIYYANGTMQEDGRRIDAKGNFTFF